VLVLKSTYRPTASSGQPGDDDTQQAQTLDMSSLVVDEITLVGSRCGPFAPALRLLESRLVDPRPLISAAFPLAEGAAAFERAARPEALKVLLAI
jgi:threonine dehydrogenase-like Zn-dependent dehydrogenase